MAMGIGLLLTSDRSKGGTIIKMTVSKLLQKPRLWLITLAAVLLIVVLHQLLLPYVPPYGQYAVLAALSVVFLISFVVFLYALYNVLASIFGKRPAASTAIQTVLSLLFFMCFGVVLSIASLSSMCQIQKQILMANAVAFVTFEEADADALVHSGWYLNWHDIEVPIPNAAFDTLFLEKYNDLDFTIFLHDPANINVVLSYFENQAVDDLFATTDINGGLPGKTKTTERGRQTTRSIYGGPTRISELLEIGYSYTPKDLNCSVLSWLKKHNEQTKISHALILKSAGNPYDIIRVFRGVGSYPGWLEQAQMPNGMRLWKASILSDKFPDHMLCIDIIVKNKSTDEKIGYSIGRRPPPMSTNRPAWLTSLEVFLRTHRKSDCVRLREGLRESGFSEKSLRNIEKVCKSCM
jgi:hypothetical protein